MIDLDEHLQRLAGSVELPATTPEDDLARGRARRRHRNLGVAGAAATTAAVIGVSVMLLPGGLGNRGAGADFAGNGGSPGEGQTKALDGQTALRRVEERSQTAAAQAQQSHRGFDSLAEARSPRVKAALSGYRDILRADLDPAGTHIQLGPITNEQGGTDSLGTKLSWNGGGMLQVAVGRSLEGVQFFCDGACATQTVTGASKAWVLSSPGKISVAVFQDDGDIVALTADTSFGNNGTSTRTLGLTIDQLLAAAADPRLDLPASPADQSPGAVGTQ
jgi:hypothetical protein